MITELNKALYRQVSLNRKGGYGFYGVLDTKQHSPQIFKALMFLLLSNIDLHVLIDSSILFNLYNTKALSIFMDSRDESSSNMLQISSSDFL